MDSIEPVRYIHTNQPPLDQRMRVKPDRDQRPPHHHPPEPPLDVEEEEEQVLQPEDEVATRLDFCV